MLVASTIIVGLNGALQKRFLLPYQTPLTPGNVHRATEVQVGVGGKGQDVAIALSCLDYQGIELAQFIGSGPEGDSVMDMLKERLGAGEAACLTVRPKSQLRTCTTIVGCDTSTELVEPSGTVDEESQDRLLEMIRTKKNNVAALCIMGSMPPGCPKNLYARIYEESCSEATLCLIDSVAGLVPLLEKISGLTSTDRKRTILKLNASELCRLVNVAKATTEAGGIHPDELIQAVQTLCTSFCPASRQALCGLAVTDGRHPAFYVGIESDGIDVFQIEVPDLSTAGTLYPIGAGDAVAAGTLAAWRCLDQTKDLVLADQISNEITEREKLVKDATAKTVSRRISVAFAFGLCCGSASCLEEQNSVLQEDKVLGLFREVGPPRLLSALPFARRNS